MNKVILVTLCAQLSGCNWVAFGDEYVERESKVGELSRELFVECMTLSSKIARQDSMNEISAVVLACSEQANTIANQTVK